MEKKRFLVLILGFLLLSACLLGWVAFKPGHREEGEPEKDHSSVEEAAGFHRSLDSLRERFCEHDKPILECEECRYEVGAVRIDPSLLTSTDGRSPLIKVERVCRERSSLLVEAVGEIQPDPDKIMTVRSRMEGVITVVKADLGQKVRPGQILLEMNSNNYRELHLEFLRLNHLLKLAHKNYEREERLFQKRLTTEKDFLEAQSEAERMTIEMNTTAQKLMLMGLSEEELQELPGHREIPHPCYLPVRSPMAGIVVEREVARGEQVEAGAKLLTVADLSRLWIWVNLYEKDLGLLQSALREGEIGAEISVATYPERVFTGKVDYIAEKMDEHTRTLRARILLLNEEKLLKLGMFVHCDLFVSSGREMLLIPREALMKDGDEAFVFRQEEDDLFIKRIIKPGREVANGVEVLEGLKENDRIVSHGAFSLKSDIMRAKMGAGCAD